VERTIQGYAAPGGGAVATLGAEDPALLLGLAEEQDALLGGESPAVLGGDVVLSHALGEGQDGHPEPPGAGLHGANEAIADGGQHGCGGDGQIQAAVDEADQTPRGLQPRLVEVHVHAVDAVQGKGDVSVQNLGDASFYTHLKLGWAAAPCRGPTTAWCGPIAGPVSGPGSDPPEPDYSPTADTLLRPPTARRSEAKPR